jgi:hypothetical protein
VVICHFIKIVISFATYFKYFRDMKESKISLGAGIGLIGGIIMGSVTNNIGLWIALGLCIGAGIGSVIRDSKSKP